MTEEYNQYLENLDKILIAIKDNPDYLPMGNVLAAIQYPKYDKDVQRLFADKLKADGHVFAGSDTGGTHIKITSRGIDFISNGGYMGHRRKEQEKEQLDIDLKTSTIKANKSNQEYYNFTKWLTVFNVILAIIMVLITFYKH